MRLAALLSVLLLGSLGAQAQTTFQQASTNTGNIGLTISNVGTIGRPGARTDPQGPPSMEYPLNSGIEHLFEGGIWIGALYNGQTTVSTASVDATNGYVTGGSGFEFTQLSGITERSSLPESQAYSGAAVSHQDFITNFTDSNRIVPVANVPITDHNTPLKAVVHLETYAWNFSYADYFVILNYTITNKSTSPWDSVYLGLWTDLVVRNINVTQETGTAFFNKGGGGYIDSLFGLYAYEVSGDDVDYTHSYGASQFLGINYRGQYFHPNNAKNLATTGLKAPKVNANFWNFRSFDGTTYGAPADDLERYLKMKNGLDWSKPNDPNGPQQVLSKASNKTQLLSVGPIPRIEPGETVNFVLAMVCARQIPEGSTGTADTKEAKKVLADHMNWARRTYLGEDLNENGQLDAGEDLNNNNKLDRYILPEPPAVPKIKYVPGNQALDIYWSDNSVKSVDPISKKKDFEGYRIYKSGLGDDQDQSLNGDAKLIAQWDSAGNNIGYDNGFDSIRLAQPMTFEGDTVKYNFHYRVNGLLNGWQYMFIVTAFDKGDPAQELPILESSSTQGAARVLTGTPATTGNADEIGIYPNPYRGTAAWDGPSTKTRKIYFYNLPKHAEITIYTLSGDVVARLQHNGDTYNGDDIRWFRDYAQGNVVTAGGEHAWDLLSTSGQFVSEGLYIVSVKDQDSGHIRTGKFSILK